MRPRRRRVGAAPARYAPPPQPGAVPQPLPSYGYPVAPQTDGTAIVVLVPAIGSFVVLPVVAAIVALVLAPSAERTIAASGGRLSGDSLVQAGRNRRDHPPGAVRAVRGLLIGFFGLLAAVGFSQSSAAAGPATLAGCRQLGSAAASPARTGARRGPPAARQTPGRSRSEQSPDAVTSGPTGA